MVSREGEASNLANKQLLFDWPLFAQIIDDQIDRQIIVLRHHIDNSTSSSDCNVIDNRRDIRHKCYKVRLQTNKCQDQEYDWEQSLQIHKIELSGVKQDSKIVNLQQQQVNHDIGFSNLEYFEYEQFITFILYNQKFQFKERLVFEYNLFKVRFKKSISYVSQLLNIEKYLIILTFVLCVIILRINYQTEYNKHCIYKGKDDNRNGECPRQIYFQIQLRNISSYYFQWFNLLIMIMNCQQFKYKKVVSIVSAAIIFSYLCYKTWVGLLQRDIIYEPLRSSSILVILICLKIYNKQNTGIFISRVISIFVFVTMIVLFLTYTIKNLQNHNIWTQLVIQYITYFLKKLLLYQVNERIKQKLYYEDLVNILYLVSAQDYIFIFRQFLILDLLFENRMISLTNFIIIQYQNIFNVHPFYNLYRTCIASRIMYLKTLICSCLVFSFFVRIINLANSFQIYLVSLVIKTKFVQFLKHYMTVDNYQATVQRDTNLKANGYEKYTISIDDIKQYFSQQTVIAYFYFLLFQLILIYNEILAHPRANYNYYLLYVHKPKQNEYPNYNINNIVIFNIILLIFMIVLVMNKKLIDYRRLNQISVSQPFMVRLLVSFCFISQINQICFYNIHLTPSYNLQPND